MDKTNIAFMITVILIFIVGLAKIQGWITLDRNGFFLIEGSLLGLAYFTLKEKNKNISWQQAWNIAKPALESAGVTTVNGAELDWMFLRKENGEYSETGNIWDIQGKGNPRRAAVFIHRHTGEIMGLDTTAGDREPPTGFEPKMFLLPQRKGKRKVNIEEENT